MKGDVGEQVYNVTGKWTDDATRCPKLGMHRQYSVTAVIADTYSGEAMAAAGLLSVFRVPIVSPGATSEEVGQ